MKTYKIYLGKHPLFNTTKPLLMGEFEGSSFKEACKGYFEEKAKNTPNNINLYEEDKGEFWGTKVYETEEEASIEFDTPEKELLKSITKQIYSIARKNFTAGFGHYEQESFVIETINLLNHYVITPKVAPETV